MSETKGWVEPLEDRRLFALNGFDATFGDGGFASLDGLGEIRDVHVLPDGRILVLGDVGLRRYSPAGRIDASFGDGGTVATPADWDAGIHLLRGGRIAVPLLEGILVLTADGRPDTRFDPDGVLDVVGAVAFDQEGRLLTADVRAAMSTLCRYVAAGDLDETFGVGGCVRSPEVPRQWPEWIFVQDTGRILIAGISRHATEGRIRYQPGASYAVSAFTATGELDVSYGTDGQAVRTIANEDAFIADAAMEPSGALHLTGYSVTDTETARFSLSPDGRALPSDADSVQGPSDVEVVGDKVGYIRLNRGYRDWPGQFFRDPLEWSVGDGPVTRVDPNAESRLGTNGFRAASITPGGDAVAAYVHDGTTSLVHLKRDLIQRPYHVRKDGRDVWATQFDTGGAGLSYVDTTPGIQGNYDGPDARRGQSVDVYRDAAAGPVYVRAAKGEWLQYTVETTVRGAYAIEFNFPKSTARGTLYISIDGRDVATVAVPAGGGVVRTPRDIQLDRGRHVVRVTVVEAAKPGVALSTFRFVRPSRLDPDFGVAGLATVDVPGAIGTPLTARDDSGRTVIATRVRNDAGRGESIVLTRLLTDQSLDTRFGDEGAGDEGGAIVLPFDGPVEIQSIATDVNGSYVGDVVLIVRHAGVLRLIEVDDERGEQGRWPLRGPDGKPMRHLTRALIATDEGWPILVAEQRFAPNRRRVLMTRWANPEGHRDWFPLRAPAGRGKFVESTPIGLSADADGTIVLATLTRRRQRPTDAAGDVYVGLRRFANTIVPFGRAGIASTMIGRSAQPLTGVLAASADTPAGPSRYFVATDALPGRAVVVAFNMAGSPDDLFSRNGIVATPFDRVRGLHPLLDGGVLVVGDRPTPAIVNSRGRPIAGAAFEGLIPSDASLATDDFDGVLLVGRDDDSILIRRLVPGLHG